MDILMFEIYKKTECGIDFKIPPIGLEVCVGKYIDPPEDSYRRFNCDLKFKIYPKRPYHYDYIMWDILFTNKKRKAICN